MLNNDLRSLFSCNLLCFGYYVSDKQERTYGQNKGGFTVQHFQTSFFYDLQELVRHSPLLRKYYYLFKALNLSALPDRNYGVGATGHSELLLLPDHQRQKGKHDLLLGIQNPCPHYERRNLPG